jgi:hypothetical protein
MRMVVYLSRVGQSIKAKQTRQANGIESDSMHQNDIYVY